MVSLCGVLEGCARAAGRPDRERSTLRLGCLAEPLFVESAVGPILLQIEEGTVDLLAEGASVRERHSVRLGIEERPDQGSLTFTVFFHVLKERRCIEDDGVHFSGLEKVIGILDFFDFDEAGSETANHIRAGGTGHRRHTAAAQVFGPR